MYRAIRIALFFALAYCIIYAALNRIYIYTTSSLAERSSQHDLDSLTTDFCLGIRIRSEESLVCGRYRLSRRKQLIAEYFETESEVDWEPRYNVAPSQDVGIIRQDLSMPKRHFSRARWGSDPVLGQRCQNRP